MQVAGSTGLVRDVRALAVGCRVWTVWCNKASVRLYGPAKRHNLSSSRDAGAPAAQGEAEGPRCTRPAQLRAVDVSAPRHAHGAQQHGQHTGRALECVETREISGASCALNQADRADTSSQ